MLITMVSFFFIVHLVSTILVPPTLYLVTHVACAYMLIAIVKFLLHLHCLHTSIQFMCCVENGTLAMSLNSYTNTDRKLKLMVNIKS
jgi:hypothetical protein